MPLGDYEHLREWTNRPRGWAVGNAQFGGGVVDHLVAGLVDFLAELAEKNSQHSARYARTPVAVGCVPWLTSKPVAEALMRFRSLILIDKASSQYSAVAQLHGADRGLWSQILGTDYYAPVDSAGAPRLVGPYDELGDSYEPVRVIGWQRSERGRAKPLLHAKLLVIGTTMYYDDPDDGSGPFWARVRPERVWAGSANWTEASSAHIEFGTWIDDHELCDEALGFLVGLLKFSEPFSAGTAGPEPNLAPIEWDDDAMWEAMHDDGR